MLVSKDDDMTAFEEYEKDLRKAERKVAGEIDPGARAVVVAVCVLIGLVSLILPHTGDVRGIDVFTMSDAAVAEYIALPSRIFVYLLLIFGIGLSALALITRRWVIAWLALCGSAVASVAGMLAIWTRNTVGVDELNDVANPRDPSGAGLGLLLGWFVVIVLTFHWARVVWARTNYHLAVEAERRDQAAKQEALGLSLQRRRSSSEAAASKDDEQT
ncbi:hypothetical protein [Gordonia zhaorongruii]|uniref:Rv2732c family membrane protein n=1 Tax=Gordonia zhaorongruii TaxID=2597659 RepID=UPI0010458728|nr:hypothetical protein [Gordonia zhaorongruii]